MLRAAVSGLLMLFVAALAGASTPPHGRLVADIAGGSEAQSSSPHLARPVSGRLVFVAGSNGILHRRELWITDGSPEGTRLLVGVPTLGSVHAIAANESYVVISSPQLWSFDLQTAQLRRLPFDAIFASQVALIGQTAFLTLVVEEPGSQSSRSVAIWAYDLLSKKASPLAEGDALRSNFVTWKDQAFFVLDRSLMTSDGTGRGTHVLAVYDRSEDPSPYFVLLPLAERVMIFGDDGTLWSTDGTGGAEGPLLEGAFYLDAAAAPDGSSAFLVRTVSGPTGDTCQLWQTQGTAASTSHLFDLPRSTRPVFPCPSYPVVSDQRLFYTQ